MKRTIQLGKIDYLPCGRKENAVEVTLELTERGGEPTFKIVNGERIYTGKYTQRYTEFTASGVIYNRLKTDWLAGGQIVGELEQYFKTPLAKEIVRLWKSYHLNGMHAGTPEQEAALEKHHADGAKHDYKSDCEYLKSIGLYEVDLDGEKYRYGTKWLVQDIPQEDLDRIKHIIGGGTI